MAARYSRYLVVSAKGKDTQIYHGLTKMDLPRLAGIRERGNTCVRIEKETLGVAEEVESDRNLIVDKCLSDNGELSVENYKEKDNL